MAKDTLKKNDLLLLLGRYAKYKEFREWVKLYENPAVLQYQRFGNKNPGRPIYFISDFRETLGFFVGWRCTLESIAYAEQYHLTPVVCWPKNVAYYQEGYGVNENPWEYYFEPLSDISVEDAKESEQVVLSRRGWMKADEFKDIEDGKNTDFYSNLTNFVDTLAKYNKKYIHIKEDIKIKADNEIEELLQNKKTVAVHVRGVEWGNIKGHPKPLQLSEYYQSIDKAVSECGFEQIFLATDSEDTVSVFQEKYGEKVVAYKDVLRTAKGSKTLMLFDPNVTRENNHFLMGYEVLRDVLTMSACDGLIAGYSNVSLAAQVFKLSENAKYDYLDIMQTQGIVKKGISCTKAVKLMKKNKF